MKLIIIQVSFDDTISILTVLIDSLLKVTEQLILQLN
jgi:hypothetical protein